jgi:hypothetical protein
MRFEVETIVSISDDPLEMFACNPHPCLGRADRGTTLPRGYDVLVDMATGPEPGGYDVLPEPRPVHIA